MKHLNVPSKSWRRAQAATSLTSAAANFLKYTSLKGNETKAKLNYWNLIKIKRASAQERKQSTKLKKTVNSNPQNGRRYLQMTVQIKGWYPRSIRNFSNSTPKKQLIQSRNGQKT